MKALLYKDWISFRWGLFAVVVAFAINVQGSALISGGSLKLEAILGMTAAVMFTVGILISVVAQAIDMKSHVDLYLKSSPLGSRLIVLERYMWTWAMGILGTVLVVVAMYLSGENPPMFLIAAACLGITSFISAFLLPFGYLLGPQMIFIPVVIIFLILGLGRLFIRNTFNDAQLQQFFMSLVDKLDLIAWGLLVFAVVCSAVSYYASLAIYRRKMN